jgi:cytochrome c peroxidase
MIRRAVALWAVCAASCTPREAAVLRVPELGPVPPLSSLGGEPIRPAEMELGRELFFDRRLSGSGHTSCDSCHERATWFQDNLNLPTPDRSYPSDSPTLARNTPALINIGFAPLLRWDGAQDDLATAMVYPFAEPNMNTARISAPPDAVDTAATQGAGAPAHHRAARLRAALPKRIRWRSATRER